MITPTNEITSYGGKLAKFTWAANFANRDSTRSLTKQPTCKTNARTTLGRTTSSAGVYSIICWGASDSNYAISYRTSRLTVKPAIVAVTYTGPTSISSKKPVTLSAVLKMASGSAIPDRILTLKLGSGSGSQTCTTGKTSGKGAASCSITKVSYRKGKTTVAVMFAGDHTGSADFYVGGSTTKAVTIK